MCKTKADSTPRNSLSLGPPLREACPRRPKELIASSVKRTTGAAPSSMPGPCAGLTFRPESLPHTLICAGCVLIIFPVWTDDTTQSTFGNPHGLCCLNRVVTQSGWRDGRPSMR